MEVGSTGTVCIIAEDEDEGTDLYIANVGDSNGVLCKKGKAEVLTYEDKATDPSEIERVKSTGGKVENNRVGGILAVTRSFGDLNLKKSVI